MPLSITSGAMYWMVPGEKKCQIRFVRKFASHEWEKTVLTSEGASAGINAAKSFGRAKVWDFENTAVSIDQDVITFDVSVDDLIIMLQTDKEMEKPWVKWYWENNGTCESHQVFQPFQDLPSVISNGCFIIHERAPFWPQQRRQTPCKWHRNQWPVQEC